ncbi:MAG: ACP synthase [Micrococcales bacterium 73-13]|nr:MAG: ACP synthase [Micrococcales bacterium 73-13]
MSETTSPSDATAGGGRRKRHIAARVEDAFHRWRQRRARARGRVSTVIAYPGYGAPGTEGTGWVRVLARVVLVKPDAPAEQRAAKVRGWRSFLSTPSDDAEIRVRIGASTRTVPIDRGGVVDAIVPAELTPGWHSIDLSAGDGEAVATRVFVVDGQERFGIVSDVDDTVWVTALPRPLVAAWNTFIVDEHARIQVSGMAVLYERIRRQHTGAPIIYLSTGAWNIAPTLHRFLTRNLFPPGPFLLTDWGPTHDRFFRNGREHKRAQLRRLAAEFPQVRWLLIGDDGQHDEDLYAEFAREHPRNVAAVCIRQLTPTEAVLARGRIKAAHREAESPVRWFFAPDGAGLLDQLIGAGIVRSR